MAEVIAFPRKMSLLDKGNVFVESSSDQDIQLPSAELINRIGLLETALDKIDLIVCRIDRLNVRMQLLAQLKTLRQELLLARARAAE